MSSTRVDLAELTAAIGGIPDPEVPVLTIGDLGILRSVEEGPESIVVTITPTYSGCPAMHHIEQEVNAVLAAHQVEGKVAMVFSPAWSTDWMTDVGRKKLEAYGIAPPRPVETSISITQDKISCPQCSSTNTQLISRFGSTACKSLRRCLDCLEPFDHFKEF